MIKYLLILLVFFTSATYSKAEIISWTGAINTSWENSGNWDKNRVPTALDEVVIDNKLLAPILDQDRTILSLKVNLSNIDLATYTLSTTNKSDINKSTVYGGGLNFIGENCGFVSSTIFAKCLSNVATVTLASSIFENDVNFTAGSWSFNHNIFKGLTTIIKNGSSGDLFNGHNVYKKPTIITNQGTGGLTLTYQQMGDGDTYESDVEINVESTGNINTSYFSKNNFFNGRTTLNLRGTGGIGISNGNGSTTFNGDLVINCISSGVGVGTYNNSFTTFNGNIYLTSPGHGIQIGGYAGNGSSLMAEGKTFIFDADFAGTLSLFDFTRRGEPDDKMLLNCSHGTLQFRRCAFESSLEVNCKKLNFTINTFHSNLSVTTKNGYSDNCIYKKNCLMTILEGYGKSTETHLGDLTINNPQLMSGGNFTLGGNLIANGKLGVGGYANFVGINQKIINAGSTAIQFLQMNSSGNLTLETPVTVISSLELNKGYINTTSSAILTLDRSCVVDGGSSASFINGPVKKWGSLSPQILPIGKVNLYKPITVTYASDANQYTMLTAEYFNADPTLVTSTQDKTSVSNCEYWKLEKVEGPGTASFSFSTENCSSIPEKDLNILYFDAKTSQWKSQASSIHNGLLSLSDFTSNYGIYALGKSASEAPISNFFLLNRAANTNPVIIKGKVLRFVYNEEYLPGKLNFNIYDSKRKIVLRSTANTSFVVPAKVYGLNEISLPLSSLIADDQPYLLEIINAKGEKQYLLFKNSTI